MKYSLVKEIYIGNFHVVLMIDTQKNPMISYSYNKKILETYEYNNDEMVKAKSDFDTISIALDHSVSFLTENSNNEN